MDIPKPYYEDGDITIYHGDCREILPFLGVADVIITDPVWPNSSPELTGHECPYELFSEAAIHFPLITDRVVVHLGCNSDPRFLLAIPESMPFFRTCSLEYVRPNYIGRLLYTGDIAYAFGTPPKSKEGARVIPGRYLDTTRDGSQTDHPTSRKLNHVRWLVKWFSDGLVVDPFMGSGTTLRAAKDLGHKAIGIEIEEKYCEMAVNRMSQSVLPL